jgi:hypothetical protein
LFTANIWCALASRNRVDRAAALPRERGEVGQQIQEPSRLERTGQQHLQRPPAGHVDRPSLVVDVPRRHVLPRREQRPDPRGEAIGGDGEGHRREGVRAELALIGH